MFSWGVSVDFCIRYLYTAFRFLFFRPFGRFSVIFLASRMFLWKLREIFFQIGFLCLQIRRCVRFYCENVDLLFCCCLGWIDVYVSTLLDLSVELPVLQRRVVIGTRYLLFCRPENIVVCWCPCIEFPESFLVVSLLCARKKACNYIFIFLSVLSLRLNAVLI